MKSVKEISITLENKPGTLSEISELIRHRRHKYFGHHSEDNRCRGDGELCCKRSFSCDQYSR